MQVGVVQRLGHRVVTARKESEVRREEAGDGNQRSAVQFIEQLMLVGSGVRDDL